MSIVRLSAAALLGYAAGSVLAADAVSRIARARGNRADVRKLGSGNPGAANVMTALGQRWGAAVLAGDIAKGGLACAAGAAIAGGAGAYVAGTTVVLGHCFPIFHRFKGGKGVATSLGTAIACFPVYVPIDLAVAGAGFAGSRHAGKASGIASVGFVAAAYLWYRFRLPNAWGPRPSAALPAYAAMTSAAIAYKFISGAKLEARLTAAARQANAAELAR